MDAYPTLLRPVGQETASFPIWWGRVSRHFSTVPRNVGRQWLWRHWGLSSWYWLPSAGAHFKLVKVDQECVLRLSALNFPPHEMLSHGVDMLRLASRSNKNYYYPLAGFMNRHKCWPCPPIVLSRRYPVPGDTGVNDAPYILVEGHQRVCIAKALASGSELAPTLPVWLLEYGPIDR